MNHSLSYSSSCISEFFDAREYGTDVETDTDDDDDEDDDEEGETGASDSEESGDDDQVIKATLCRPKMLILMA